MEGPMSYDRTIDLKLQRQACLFTAIFDSKFQTQSEKIDSLIMSDELCFAVSLLASAAAQIFRRNSRGPYRQSRRSLNFSDYRSRLSRAASIRF
ncbi:hypothetical protein KIN20_018726 [Parelaphostrongylus tenuis]|uniref:Uncharacterized protein n=1 Tax=Parelaphostrongylus tenuis TaxID=148309 RepID=A0AAD5QSD6_PARTN|nr:hypothetical protein KIN20_018726 [Parelaphostrongylus tenuis]